MLKVPGSTIPWLRLSLSLSLSLSNLLSSGSLSLSLSRWFSRSLGSEISLFPNLRLLRFVPDLCTLPCACKSWMSNVASSCWTAWRQWLKNTPNKQTTPPPKGKKNTTPKQQKKHPRKAENIYPAEGVFSKTCGPELRSIF